MPVLLANGADVNATQTDDADAVMTALAGGHYDIYELLTTTGTKPGIAEAGNRALCGKCLGKIQKLFGVKIIRDAKTLLINISSTQKLVK